MSKVYFCGKKGIFAKNSPQNFYFKAEIVAEIKAEIVEKPEENDSGIESFTEEVVENISAEIISVGDAPMEEEIPPAPTENLGENVTFCQENSAPENLDGFCEENSEESTPETSVESPVKTDFGRRLEEFREKISEEVKKFPPKKFSQKIFLGKKDRNSGN